MTELKKRRVYLARTKRIFFTLFVAIVIAGLLGMTLYFTWTQLQQGAWWLVAAGITTSIVMLSAFSVALREASIAIQRRGYARPVGTSGTLQRVVKSIFPPAEFETSHPSAYTRSRILVQFDDHSTYDVDLGVFYFVLLGEVNKTTGILSWEQCVVKNKMDKRAWAAYRKLLEQAGVVEKDGRGSMRLNCQPWSAIEVIKERC